LDVGRLLADSSCSAEWSKRFREYVEFVNASGQVLVEAAIDSRLEAFVLIGRSEDLRSSQAYQLELGWASRSGSLRYAAESPSSYIRAYGPGNFVQFATYFMESASERIPGVPCSAIDPGIDPARYAGLALLQEYAFSLSDRVRSFQGEEPHPTLIWRTHRRLLSAMRKLPAQSVSPDEIKSLLIHYLSLD
jgi:hypothetical protein